MSDPKFSALRVLKPFRGFEAQYSGKLVTLFDILLHPEGIYKDYVAGQPGYDPNLARGLQVPIGSRVILWMPKIFWIDYTVSEVPVLQPYSYSIIWRLRSLADNQHNPVYPWHIATQLSGLPETAVDPGARFVIPAAESAIIYNSADPATFIAPAIQDLRAERFNVQGNASHVSVNTAGGSAVVQQGVLPATFGGLDRRYPAWNAYETQAVGDEMLISVRRESLPVATTWDFSSPDGADLPFSEFYGAGFSGGPFPFLGVYAMVGTST